MNQDLLCAEARAIYNNLCQLLPDALIMEPVIFGEAVRCLIEGKEPQCPVDIYFSNFPVPAGCITIKSAYGRQWRVVDHHYFHTRPDYSANLLVVSLEGQVSARLGCNPLECLRDIQLRILRPCGGHIPIECLERLGEYN
jgi:hypothetical protein